MRTGVCDGEGACAFHAPGTVCGKNLCVEDIEVDLECDGQGHCAPHISKQCGGGCASDGGCALQPCRADAGCDGGSRCDADGAFCDAGTCEGGACARQPSGPCASDSDCDAPLRCDFDGRCVDPRQVTESPSACAIERARGSTRAAWALLGVAALSLFVRQWSARSSG
jgi:hypothetical protein